MRTAAPAILLACVLGGAGSACTSEEVVWPLSKSGDVDADRITDPFGPRDQNGTYDFHAGLDFATPIGTKVRAIKAGTVEKTVAWDGKDSTGNWVLIDHGGGEKSAYLHLSKIKARQGEHVRAGEVIGRSGDTGANSAHLHLNYMVGIDHPGADEALARNALEILPHSDMPTPSYEFTADGVTVTMVVRPNTVEVITLEGAGQSRSLDYYEVVARGNPDRDDHVQSGIWIDAVDIDHDTFTMTLRPEPADFVPDRVILTAYDGEVVLDAAR